MLVAPVSMVDIAGILLMATSADVAMDIPEAGANKVGQW